ncbi:MAG TPA: glycosyltransferase family 2 protein [Candidatus Binatia bacterium]|nr:glycosyltransferase family 2 protein [Candidatus Binatia bacterium]
MTDTTGATDVSLVIPMLNEAENVREVHRRASAALSNLRQWFEIVFVDDGSTDATPQALRQLADGDPRVRVVRLKENCGQHAALMAGLRHARGAIVVTLDADMQTPPSEIPALLAKLGDGFDVVFGVFAARHHPWHQRMTSALGHTLIERALGVPRGVHFSPFRALRRSLVDRIVQFRGSPIQLEVLLAQHARSMGVVTVPHGPRYAGATKYGPRRRLRFVLNVIQALHAVRREAQASASQYDVAERIGFDRDALVTEFRIAG